MSAIELVSIAPTADDPKESIAKLVPLGDGRFRLESKNGFSNDGEIVTFESGADGAVTRMRVGYNYSRRLAPGER